MTNEQRAEAAAESIYEGNNTRDVDCQEMSELIVRHYVEVFGENELFREAARYWSEAYGLCEQPSVPITYGDAMREIRSTFIERDELRSRLAKLVEAAKKVLDTELCACPESSPTCAFPGLKRTVAEVTE